MKTKAAKQVVQEPPEEPLPPPTQRVVQPPPPQKKEKKEKKKAGLFGWLAGKNSSDDDDSEEEPVTKSIQQPKQIQPKPVQKVEIHPMNEREMNEIGLMRELTRAYLQIVRTSIEDFIPKAIMHFLVNQTCKDLQNALIQDLYKGDKVNELMNESPAVTVKREMLKKNLDALQTAHDVLEGIVTTRID